MSAMGCVCVCVYISCVSATTRKDYSVDSERSDSDACT